MPQNDKQAQPALVLASTSPRRQQLIGLLGLPVQVVPSHADEDTPADWRPDRIVEELARRKASAVAPGAAGTPGAIVVGSDTIVVLEGEVLGKPKDAADAEAMLARLSGRGHEVYTGVCCIEAATGRTEVAHSRTRVFMRRLSAAEIAGYVAGGEPLDKAGSYGVQGTGALFIERIEGDFYSVMGLPLNLLYEMLLTLGADPFANAAP